MNPYQLNLSVVQHIDALVKQSKLSRQKRDDIKRELTAFAEDYGRELHFDGKDATEIDALVIAAIGTSEKRGKEFMIANQKLSRIPWIGPLFYDEVVRGGVVIFLTHIATVICAILAVWLISEVLYRLPWYANIQYENGVIVNLWENIILRFSEVGPFFIAAFILGMLVRFRFKTLIKSIDVMTVAFSPLCMFFLCLMLQHLFTEYLNPYVNLRSFFFIVFGAYILPAYLGLLIPTHKFKNI